ncbi:MAG: hypothetical protein MZV64_73360 [Ignavibacteriales bacterium]|nr:hypothetical protein [Ignavibacteriales bacterium]
MAGGAPPRGRRAPTRRATTGWRWPSPSPRSGPSGTRGFAARSRCRSPTPGSSTRSRGCAGEGGQDLPGRVHGRRQVLARPRDRAPPRLEASRTSTNASRRASAGPSRRSSRRDGEAYFRAVERDVVQELLPPRHVVVATGGGTFVDPDLRALMKADGAVFWIDAPLGADHRPAARATGAGRWPPAACSSRASTQSRRFAYAQAHVRLDAARASVGDLADQVVEWLGA